MIDELTELKDLHGGETAVNIASQPAYPFEYSIKGIAFEKDLDPVLDEDEQEFDSDQEPRVLILEGQQLRYGEKVWWDQ